MGFGVVVPIGGDGVAEREKEREALRKGDRN